MHTHTVQDKMWTESKFTIQYLCMYTCVHTHTHMCACMHSLSHTLTHTLFMIKCELNQNSQSNIHACTRVCIHTHTCACMHSLSHTHTHTHTLFRIRCELNQNSQSNIHASTHMRPHTLTHTHTHCSGQNMNWIRIYNLTYLWSPVLSMSPAEQPRRVPSAHCWRRCQQRTQRSLGWRKFGHCLQLFSQMAWKIFNNFPPETAVTLKFNQYYQDLHKSVKFSKVITQSLTYTISFAFPVVGCYGIKQ